MKINYRTCAAVYVQFVSLNKNVVQKSNNFQRHITGVLLDQLTRECQLNL